VYNAWLAAAARPRWGLPAGRHRLLSVPREAGLTQAIGRFFTDMRTYELVFVVDPRVSDEDVVAMTQEYKQMITAGGSQVSKEESWGRRKLAYPIAKLNEGKYVLLGIESEGGKSSLPAVEHRMRQNDKILRYLTVRTDEDLKRAASRHPKTAGRTGESPAGTTDAAAGPGGPAAAAGAAAGEV
jgi:small subunit ribosomal protein S6